MPTSIANEVANEVALFGTETIPGTAVTPTARLRGDLEITKSQGIRRTEEATGQYDRLVNPTREPAAYAGTYGEPLTYESLPKLLRYGVAGGGAGSSLGSGAYEYLQVPNGWADDIDSMTVEYGIEGRAFRSTGVRFSQFTISADTTNQDDNWMFSSQLFVRDKTRLPGGFEGTVDTATDSTVVVVGAAFEVDEYQDAWLYLDYGSGTGQVRKIASNTVDTLTLEGPALDPVPSAGEAIYISGLLPVIANDEEEAIVLEGTQFFVDPYNATTSTTGTTNVSDRILSFNLTEELNLAQKRRFSGIIAKVGRGARWFTGSVRFEADRWDEYMQWEEMDPVSLRIEKVGSEIGGGTRKRARIDIERAFWDVYTEDADNNNRTCTLTFIAAIPEGTDIVQFDTINGLATLP